MVQNVQATLGCKKTSSFKVTAKDSRAHCNSRDVLGACSPPAYKLSDNWQRLEAQSRDECLSFSTRGYYSATMDQTCPSLNTATACSILSLTIVRWLHLVNQAATVDAGRRLPSPATLDRLLLEGSRRWRRFLSLPQVRAISGSDGLHELDTALRYSKMGVRADDTHSFTAFFQPPSPAGEAEHMGELEVACEALGFESVWESLVTEASAEKQGMTYVVGWNGHYFVLYIPPGSAAKRGAFYVVDTLGRRLSADCNQAYILKLDSSSTLLMNSPAHGGEGSNTKITSGADACRVFLRDLLAGAAVKEVVSDYKKGLVSQQKLLQTMQIDFRAVIAPAIS